MSSKTNSGIQTASDGSSFIPASRRPDGSIRKEIKVRPGFKPTEDIAAYKTPTAAARSQFPATVPGVEPASTVSKSDTTSKNAKRREAARKRAAAGTQDKDLETSSATPSMATPKQTQPESLQLAPLEKENESVNETDVEKQKKLRNTLKKLKAVRELKEKAASGGEMSLDQLVKIGKEDELVRDLRKLGYDGVEMTQAFKNQGTNSENHETV